MTVELIGAVVFFALTVFALAFSLTKSSQVENESFPNRGRFFSGLVFWILTGILAVFVSFPGYPVWFVPVVYPILKIAVMVLFLVGFFLILTTANAFPVHLDIIRREINGRADRITLMENIRRITTQPFPLTEVFTLVLKELASHLVVKKGALFLVNPSRREMYLTAQIGLTKEELSRLERFPLGKDIVSRAASEQMPFVSGEVTTSDSSTRKLLLFGREISMSAAAMPLACRDRSLGVLLMISEKPYRFEKNERLLLGSVAEALAVEVEANRLGRENRKLSVQTDTLQVQLERLQGGLSRMAQRGKHTEIADMVCRDIAERYKVAACRVVSLADGQLTELAAMEASPDLSGQSQSYRIAIIEAIRQKKMVILNQEAKDQAGDTYINRSTLLCPFGLWKPGDFAFLVETPGNGLPVSQPFLRDIETAVNLVAMALNISGLKETEGLGQAAIRALLGILQIQTRSARGAIFRKFLEETARIAASTSAILIYIPDNTSGYRFVDGHNGSAEAIAGITFLPGEGPIGKAAASGNILEYSSAADVEKAWTDLETVNRDYLVRLFGEKGGPVFQITIPVTTLEQVSAVVVVFSHVPVAPRDKGLLLLAAQLLSIKLSMAHMESQASEAVPEAAWPGAGDALNRLNNNLATVIGRAQLLERQSDISGSARYSASEIIKASEGAAEIIKQLQQKFKAADSGRPAVEKMTFAPLRQYLKRRHVTGNLYMFEGNRAVTLETAFEPSAAISVSEASASEVVEKMLEKFVALIEEGEEVLLKSELRGERFLVSLVRGPREQIQRFDPSRHDFGEPDVLPRDLVADSQVKTLQDCRAEVSFDRFGRRPTYLSISFPAGEGTISPVEVSVQPERSGFKILAIDDQQMILDLLAGISQSLGLSLTAVKNPAEAMELFRREKFDVVMVDLAMGEISGWDVAREVKRVSSATPVVMMTGWGINLPATDARRAGIDYTLSKPFKIEQLIDVINQARQKLPSSR